VPAAFPVELAVDELVVVVSAGELVKLVVKLVLTVVLPRCAEPLAVLPRMPARNLSVKLTFLPSPAEGDMNLLIRPPKTAPS